MANQELSNPSQAIARSIQITGLDIVSSHAVATKITVTNDYTPFLASQINGRTAWRVVFDGGCLRLKSAPPGFPDRYPRTFAVLIDEHTGQLLSVRSRYNGRTADFRPEPTAAFAESEMRPSREIYLAIPAVKPNLTFVDALDAVQKSGFGSPLGAKEMDGSYVVYTSMGSAPKPVWVIEMRGLPPSPGVGPPPPLPGEERADAGQGPGELSDHIRTVVDATTGAILDSGNVP